MNNDLNQKNNINNDNYIINQISENLAKTLSNSVRLKIILCIGEKSKTVTEIIENCGLSQSAVSQHLSKLKQSDLLKYQKKGRKVTYSLKYPKLLSISKDILSLQKEVAENAIIKIYE